MSDVSRHDALIDALGAELTPVRRLLPPWVRTVGWLAIVAFIGGVMLSRYGAATMLRRWDAAPDLGMAALGAVLTAITASLAAFALAVPGRFQQDIELSSASGEQARVRETLPTKLIMADEALAVVPTATDEALAEVAYVIRSSALLAALAALFEHEWSRGVPLVAGPRQSPDQLDQPDEKTRALLSLLAGGLTDEAVSRALGWSARTTQRRIAALLKELGVSTRFQAGAAARDRGWL